MLSRSLYAMFLVVALSLGCSDDSASPDGSTPGVDSRPANEAGVTPDGAPQKDGQTPTTGTISQAELQRLTAALADDSMNGRDEGTPGGKAARDFIIAELQKCGVQPAGDGNGFEQAITAGEGTNIIGKIEGSGTAAQKARHVLISAHYDHLGSCGGQICNGADDNAAGVALVIQVACALAKNPPARSVIVASWDAEEPPTFLSDAMGSQYWVAHPTVPLAQIDVAIALDLVGGDLWEGFEGHLVLGDELSPEVSAALEGATKPAGLQVYHASLHLVEETVAGHQPWSDYDAFRNQGLPILFLSNGQNKRYHTSADELDTVNLPKMKLEADYLLAMVQELANRSGDGAPTYDGSGTAHARDAANMITVLEAALDPQGLVKNLISASKAALQSDLAAVQAIKTKLDGGGSLTSSEVTALRTAAQRVMCLAGSSLPEYVCTFM